MLFDLITKRFSVRDYETRKIEKEKLEKIVESGRLAPSWMNVQPWKFVVIESEDEKKELEKVCFSQKQVSKAACLIFVIGDTNAWNDENFEKILMQKPNATKEMVDSLLKNPLLNPRMKDENYVLLRTQEQCAIALSFMLLEAKSLGVDSCVLGAISSILTDNSQESLEIEKRLLHLQKGEYVASVLALGYKAEEIESPLKQRKSKNETVLWK